MWEMRWDEQSHSHFRHSIFFFATHKHHSQPNQFQAGSCKHDNIILLWCCDESKKQRTESHVLVTFIFVWCGGISFCVVSFSFLIIFMHHCIKLERRDMAKMNENMWMETEKMRQTEKECVWEMRSKLSAYLDSGLQWRLKGGSVTTRLLSVYLIRITRC